MGHRAKGTQGMGHSVRRRSVEGAGGAKGLRVMDKKAKGKGHGAEGKGNRANGKGHRAKSKGHSAKGKGPSEDVGKRLRVCREVIWQYLKMSSIRY
ncbi:MAG: hypothetical protein PVI94_14030 [Desulfobacterales bacterium]